MVNQNVILGPGKPLSIHLIYNVLLIACKWLLISFWYICVVLQIGGWIHEGF